MLIPAIFRILFLLLAMICFLAATFGAQFPGTPRASWNLQALGLFFLCLFLFPNLP